MKNFLAGIVWLIVVLTSSHVSGIVINVPGDYSDIKPAVDAAVNGDTVLVADGTYAGELNRHIHVVNKEIDIVSVNGPDHCVLDCEHQNYGFYFQGAGYYPLLSGFTIRNGYTEGGGGGLLLYCSVTIENCILSGCSAQHDGGAIKYASSPPVITQCLIENCSADLGGGINGDSYSDITFCTFQNNSARAGGGFYFGHANTTVTNCNFIGNTASECGGGILLGSGGAIPTINYNYFEDNFAGAGADMYSYASATVNARYNDFKGNYSSGYYLDWHTVGGVNTSGCTSDTTLVYQDVYVSPTGDNDNDGLSWGTAFRNINYALSRIKGTVSDPVTVHVAEGTYTENSGERFPLQMLDYVALSGAGPDLTVIDADHSSRVMFGVYDKQITVSGLTIQKGESGNFNKGGGVFAGQLDQFELIDCHITECRGTSHGGGVYVEGTNFTMSRCAVSNNITEGGVEYGGGVYGYGDNVLISGCVFTGNKAYNSEYEASGHGGGAVVGGDNVTVHDSVFMDNMTGGFGGGLVVTSGIVSISNCLIMNNSVIGQPYSQYGGAGICVAYSYTDSLSIINTTIVNNTSAMPGGGVQSHDSSLVIDIENSIIWGNTPDNIGEGNYAVTHSDVSMDSGTYPGTGNLNSDPFFVTGTIYDYYLSHTAAGQPSDSPCMNAGSDLASNISITGPSGPVTLADLTTRTDGITDAGTVDMGFHFDLLIPEPPPTVTPIPPIPATGPAGLGIMLICMGVMLVAVLRKQRE